MRMRTRNLFILIIALFVAVSCTPDPTVRTGSLKVSLDAAGMKGISGGISMVAAEYEIVLMDAAESVIDTVSTADSSYSWDAIPTGIYKVKAYAKNSSGRAIGASETASITVYPEKMSTCRLVIAELAGNGTISIAIEGLDAFEEGTGFSIVFYRGIGGALGSFEGNEFALAMGDDGVARATASLPNGFYAFGLASTDDAGDITIIDTVRIVKDDEISVSYEYSYAGDGSVSIENSILPTPAISIAASGDAFPIAITSEISDLAGNASYAWYMDGEPISGETGASLTITEDSNIPAGSHSFMLLVISESGVIWNSNCLEIDVSRL